VGRVLWGSVSECCHSFRCHRSGGHHCDSSPRPRRVHACCTAAQPHLEASDALVPARAPGAGIWNELLTNVRPFRESLLLDMRTWLLGVALTRLPWAAPFGLVLDKPPCHISPTHFNTCRGWHTLLLRHGLITASHMITTSHMRLCFVALQHARSNHQPCCADPSSGAQASTASMFMPRLCCREAHRSSTLTLSLSL
jgi:hypothetical protein